MTSIKSKLKIKKTLTLDQMASALANDVIGAIYSAIGTKWTGQLYVGDSLTEVVDQRLDRDGMSEEQNKMSSTRIRVKVGIDCSGSMYWRAAGRPIVRGMAMMRTMKKAFDIVQQALPPDVFDYSMWLWSCRGKSSSDGYVCLTREGYDNIWTHDWSQPKGQEWVPVKVLADYEPETIDKLLEDVVADKAKITSGGTELTHMLSAWAQWDLDRGDPATHTMDIIITDGEIYDMQRASETQMFRAVGKYTALMLSIGNLYQATTPGGFMNISVRTDQLQDVMRDALFTFVQTLF